MQETNDVPFKAEIFLSRVVIWINNALRFFGIVEVVSLAGLQWLGCDLGLDDDLLLNLLDLLDWRFLFWYSRFRLSLNLLKRYFEQREHLSLSIIHDCLVELNTLLLVYYHRVCLISPNLSRIIELVLILVDLAHKSLICDNRLFYLIILLLYLRFNRIVSVL